MTARWIIATFHLLALPLGLGAIWARSRAFGHLQDAAGLHRVFVADNLWGLAAMVWLGTGLLRAFGGFEKGTNYYLNAPTFYGKMAVFVVILLLEVWPMATLIRWRIASRRGTAVDTRSAVTLARISQVQAALVVLMVFLATALARGL